MSKLLKNSGKKKGQSPGSLIYTGDKTIDGSEIHLVRYNKTETSEKVFKSQDQKIEDEYRGYRKDGEIIWLNVDGIQNIAAVEKIGQLFGIHPLTLEDILNISHRPKTEDNGSNIFIILRMLSYDTKAGEIKSEQLSIILKEKMVITFQEDKTDEFTVIRDNIRKSKGRLRDSGADYLCYRLIDTVMDNYFSVLEHIGDELESLEDELLMKPSELTLNKLYKLKNEMILIRRAIWPLREVISQLEKSDSSLLKESTHPFLRDLYDHMVQIIDTTDNYREMAAGMMDIYLSSVSNRMNEVMKILTIISTIFIPLTFIAGVYGMNFNTDKSPWNMPELNTYFGYPVVMAVMLVIAVLLIIFFRKKKWI